MRVLVQWSTATPGDWVAVDSADWASLPKKLDPIGGEIVDGRPGWISSVCVQGVCFTGDHYAVEDLPNDGGCRVHCWSDDPVDYPTGYRNAKVWTFLPCAPDAELGGAYNTRQSHSIYAETEIRKIIDHQRGGNSLKRGTVESFDRFKPPAESLIRHGIWMADTLYQAHDATLSPVDWRQWTEGIPDEEIGDDGCIRCQRDAGRWKKSKGTKTFFQNNTVLASGIHAPLQTSDEFEMSRFILRAAATQATGNLGGGADAIAFVYTTIANEPDDADWFQAGTNGEMRCQLDCTAVGANITYGVIDQGGSSGHFARVNSGLTADQDTFQQTEGTFSGTGLNLATTGSVNPGSGAAGDRFEVVITIARPADHGNQSLTLRMNITDTFADGPWRGLEDTVVVTDTITAALAAGELFERTISDTVSVVDTVATEVEFERDISDAVSVADQVDAGKINDRTISDTVVVADTVAAAMEFERSIADTVVVVDQVDAGKINDANLSDTVVVTDTVATALEFERDIADTVSVADQVDAGKVNDANLSDVVVAVDQVETALEFERDLSDAVVVTDQVDAGRIVDRDLADAVVVVDTVAALKITQIDVNLNDAVAVVDQVATEIEFERFISDTVSVVDTVAIELITVIAVAASDTVAVVDQVETEMTFKLDISDTVAVVDQVTVAAEFERAISDAVVVADQVAVEAEFERTIADTVTAVDQVGTEAEFERDISDTVAVVDTVTGALVSAGIVFNRSANDTVAVVDQIETEMSFERDIDDAVAAADTVLREAFFEREITDAVAVVDSIADEMSFERSIADVVVVADTIDGGLVVDRSAADAVAVADQIATEVSYERVPVDAVAVSDQVSIEMQFGRTISDVVDVVDTVQLRFTIAVFTGVKTITEKPAGTSTTTIVAPEG